MGVPAPLSVKEKVSSPRVIVRVVASCRVMAFLMLG
jgi:hypothetical protein